MISYESLALWINIAMVLAVGIGTLRRRGTSGAVALITLCAVVVLWTAARLVNPAVNDTLRLAIFIGAELAAAFAATAALWIILVRTNRGGFITARNILLFALIPLLILGIFGVLAPAAGGVLTQAGGRTATLHTIVRVYVFATALGGALLVLNSLLQRRRHMLSMLGVALFGSLLPVVAVILESLGFVPFGGLELLPFAYALATTAFLYGLFDRRPEEIGAIDRHAAVEGMDEGWIVLDVNDIVVDMNPAAERMTGNARDKVLGQPISTLLGDLSSLGLTLDANQEVEMKRSIRLEEGWRYLNIRISTLTDRERIPFGRLTLWRDMTERKLTEDSRQRARDEMFVLLSAISAAASNALSTEDFLTESIYQIMYPFRCQVVGIFLMDEKTKRKEEPRLLLSAHMGLPAEALEELTYLPISSPMVHWVMNNREPMQLSDAENDERVPGPMRRMPVASVLMLALASQDQEHGKFLGCMLLARKEDPAFSQDEMVRLATLADHMASLIDSDRRRKLAIALSERRRLMRDLHDSVSQKLYGLVTTTEAAQAAMEAGSNVDPRQEFARIGDHARQAVKEMRLFLYQMQQVDVEKEGLVSVLHQRLQAVEGRADIKARLLTDEEDIQLAMDTQMTLFYIAQEALNNVLRHARARSVLVTLKRAKDNAVLEILDDGVGFDVKKVDRAGLGLRNMKERAAQLDGKIQIISKPDVGTRVVVTIPIEPEIQSDNHGRRT